MKSLLNIFLIILQLIGVAAYISLANAKSYFEEISANLYPESEYLMNSYFADHMLSPLVLVFIVTFMLASVIKEFKVKTQGKKIIINFIVLFIITLLFGIVSYQLYSPIQSLS